MRKRLWRVMTRLNLVGLTATTSARGPRGDHEAARQTKGRQHDAAAPEWIARSVSGLREQLVDIFPVNEVIDKRLQIVRPAIAIIDVIGMLPDVDAEDRRGAMHQRVFAVGRLGDFELAVLHRQPGPAGAELADAGGGEIGLELVQSAEVLDDL